MLGAQALRTKQKAEQKEKEKRHRERLRSIEIQRDKLHRASCEEAAAQYLDISAQPSVKSTTTKHRHSVHVSCDNQLQVHSPHGEKVNGPQRSTSSNHCKEDRKNSSVSGSNKFLKWLGIGGNDKKDLKHRRMSTFT